MSTKNEFLSNGGFLANSITLVTLVITLANSPATVAQQPPEERPLVGGFKIDFGDVVDVVPATESAATPPENSVTGLPQTALPMAFPAAAPQSGPAKGPATLIHAGDMIGFSRELGDGVQAITIINASRRWMAVYHIDTSGQIRLTSSRPLDADFTIQFNAAAPMPEDIRRLQGK